MSVQSSTNAGGIQHAGVIKLTKDNLSAVIKGLPAKARIALSAAIHLPKGSLTVRTPDGRVLHIEGREAGPNAEVHLNNWNLPKRAFSGATIGVAESYFDEDWTSPDVTTFLELFLVNEEMGEHLAGGANWFMTLFHRVRHWLNENNKSGAKRNISAHYDLGNAFYSQWLDPSMTYSSALYSTGANDLESAQAAKYQALLQDIGAKAGDHILEIGCGWGGFAEFAARQGCKVTGLTISQEQFEYATARMEKAGLSDLVTIKFQDYRDERGIYDHIASIEMFEAVGEKYWPSYFATLRNCLKSGGKAGVQIITIKDGVFESYKARPDFIQAYVFPGGMLPTPKHLVSLGATHSLSVINQRVFPQDYARTLAEWRVRFWAVWPSVTKLGFDERFKRLWEFYLYYCEAGFRSEYIDVRQVVYSRD
ncbi:MAG: class I SAM-dependent methyltransferase [Rhizobiaceae bacterium]